MSSVFFNSFMKSNLNSFYNFCYANINSVYLHSSEINSFLAENNIDICCLAETKLKPDLHFVDNCFPGYIIKRHDRKLRRGGGVAVICKNVYVISEVAVSKEFLYRVPSEVQTEFAVYLVNGISLQSLLVVVVYRPPRAEHFSAFMARISEFLALAPRCVIAGDFNYNLLESDSDGHELCANLVELDFHILRFGPTYFHVGGHSELDFCAVSGIHVDENSVSGGSFPLTGGHIWMKFVFSQAGVAGSGGKVNGRRRDWSRYSPDDFLAALSSCDWF